ncbi:MAG: hypothetical protein JNL25_10300, partial [Rhodospirillaceae bacterium]|nr:hypothetical protein [Rhodospirillaceae bacterium]
ADALGRQLVTREFDELTAFGCAALAARGIGRTLALPAGKQAVIAPGRNAGAWRDRFADGVARARNWRRS